MRSEDGGDPPVNEDPFLRFHERVDDAYDLRHCFAPASVRDQMIRAQLLIDRALSCRLIGPDLGSLLVIGAGVAGATAAMHAALEGVPTLLIERGAQVFPRQRGQDTRFIDPTLYDWPHAHWAFGEFPLNDGTAPLRWSRGSAAAVAAGWAARFNRIANRPSSPLAFRARATAKLEAADASGLRCAITDGAGTTRQRIFAMAVDCTGFDDEHEGNRIVDRATDRLVVAGLPFWAVDDFAKRNAGLPEEIRAQVVISGAGDGALQDLIRVSTGTDARTVYELIEANYAQSEAERLAWERLLRRIQTEEERALRAWAWSDGRQTDHAVLGDLHAAYDEIVGELRWRQPHWDRLCAAFRARFHAPPEIVWLHRSPHLGRCFAMNRFVGMVLRRYLQREFAGQFSYIPGTRIVGVDPVDHICEAPRNCIGRQHVVRYAGKATGDREHAFDANVIIVRHGPSRDDGEAQGASEAAARAVTPVRRQLLPFGTPR